MTEAASEAKTPFPKRKERHSAGGGWGASAVGVVSAGTLLAAAALAWRPMRYASALDEAASDDPEVRAAGAVRLAAMRDYAAPRISRLCASSDPASRMRAVRAADALDLREDAAALGLLKQAASGKDAPGPLRGEAIACLARFAGSGGASAIQALFDSLPAAGRADPALVEGIGRVAPSGVLAREALLKSAAAVLAKPQTDPSVRAACLDAIGAILVQRADDAPPDPSDLKILHAVLAGASDPDPGMRSAADRVLDQLRGAHRVRLASESLRHEDPWVRLWAESALHEATGRASVGAGTAP